MSELQLKQAHKHSSKHKKEIEESKECGCFYCLSTYPPKIITLWTDSGNTALCPRCGIDAVIGDKSGYVIDRDFLSEMRGHWF